MKNSVVRLTKGIANRFSWAYRPGATKSQNCVSTTGIARISPARSATLMERKNPSVGSMMLKPLSLPSTSGSISNRGTMMNAVISSWKK